MTDLAFLLDECDPAERVARLRELRTLVAVYAGWDHPAKLAFDQALAGGSCAAALDELDKLPARLRRRLLASYGALSLRDW